MKIKRDLLSIKNTYIYEGILTPVEWNHNQEITKYSLFLEDGDEVPLCLRNLNKVKSLQNQHVRVWGYYNDHNKYHPSFTVKKIKAIIIPPQDVLSAERTYPLYVNS